MIEIVLTIILAPIALCAVVFLGACVVGVVKGLINCLKK